MISYNELGSFKKREPSSTAEDSCREWKKETNEHRLPEKVPNIGSRISRLLPTPICAHVYIQVYTSTAI